MFEKLLGICPSDVVPLYDYFESAYIGKVLRTIRTRSKIKVQRDVPMFPIESWNVLAATLSDQASTNNSVEAWHRRMNTIMPKSHPAFFKSLNALKVQQRSTDNESERADDNLPPPRRRRKSVEERHKRLLTILSTWKQRVTDDDKLEYVRSIAHLYSLGSHKRASREDL
jgi:hypothetical protein